MRSRTWIAAAIGLTILAAACTGQSGAPSPHDENPIAVGERAPAFTLDSAKGGTVSLSDYAGKPVLLYFSMGPG
jgi:cytochrome oxidase Cu insertion factor (SCO1/SenC/PrrC family)